MAGSGHTRQLLRQSDIALLRPNKKISTTVVIVGLLELLGQTFFVLVSHRSLNTLLRCSVVTCCVVALSLVTTLNKLSQAQL